MKILLAGDYSNYHRALSLALRRMGHEVVVASDGSQWMNTARDIDTSRPFKNKVGGTVAVGQIEYALEIAVGGI